MSNTIWLKDGVRVKIPRTKMGVVNYDSGAVRNAQRDGQVFLYYTGRSLGDFVILSEDLNVAGDYFLESEIELYGDSVFPTEWCIRITSKNREILEKYRSTLPQVCDSVTCLCGPSLNKWLVSDKWADNTYISYTDDLPCGKTYQEITDTQFKAHIVKVKENIMIEDNHQSEKKILGYKLKEEFDKQTFKDAYCKLVGVSEYTNNYTRRYAFCKTSNTEESLKRAGVLDLWFEPVYDVEFKVGDFVVVKGYDLVNDANGFTGRNVSKLEDVGINNATGMLNLESDFSIKVKGRQYNIKTSHIERHATIQEVAEYKESLLPKLPKIGDYEGQELIDTLKWGCTQIMKSTILELDSIGCFQLSLIIDGQPIYINETTFRAVVNYLKSKSN